MKDQLKILVVSLSLLWANAGLAQGDDLGKEIETFVTTAEWGDEGIFGFDAASEHKIKNDPRDWESYLAKLMDPESHPDNVCQIAFGVASARKNHAHPKILAAYPKLFKHWKDSIADIPTHETGKLGEESTKFLRIFLVMNETGDPNTLKILLDYATSKMEQERNVLNRYNRRGLIKSLAEHGTAEHLDKLRELSGLLDEEKEADNIERITAAIAQIEQRKPTEKPAPKDDPEPDTVPSPSPPAPDAQEKEPANADSGASRIWPWLTVAIILVGYGIFYLKKTKA